MNVIRILLMVLLLLSLFITAKSFIAVSNVEQWGDELREMFMIELGRAGNGSYPIESYMRRLEAIQKQWTVMRYVSIASVVLCGWGLVWVSRKDKRLGKASAGQATAQEARG